MVQGRKATNQEPPIEIIFELVLTTILEIGRQLSERSYVATFWGGALFAFSMALVRFLWVGKAALDV